MLALNSQMCATSVTLSYFHVHTAINILRCFGYPREHNFGLVLILSPTGCTEGCVYFRPSKLQEYTPPPFSRLSTQYHIDPLLTCFLSLDTSRTSLRLQQSTKFGNMHTAHGRYEYSYHLTTSRENWAQKKKSPSGLAAVERRAAKLCRFALNCGRSLHYCCRFPLYCARSLSVSDGVH